MDNDCNDFQGHNLHLVGEESSKISSVLHPYSLSKFDFDDSLQGHLRFDGLVENEVFLGIPSQEDNHWIEDFSRGSSGVEFRSTATDSCSIPRRNNVWSEATSSESVEMLLKSVGQEDMVPGESFLDGSDACDELGSLAKQMELNLRQDEKRDDPDSNHALPPIELLGNNSGLNQTSGRVDIDFKSPTERQEIEQSSFERSGVNIENSTLVLTEENPQSDAKRDDKSHQKPDSSLNESLNNRIQESSVITERQSIEECSSQNMTKDVENFGHPDMGSAEHLKSATNQLEEICEGVEEQSRKENDSDLNDGSLNTSLTEIHTSDYDPSLLVGLKIEAKQNFEVSSSFSEREGSALENRQDLHSFAETSQNSVGLEVANMEIKEHSTDNCEKSPGASQGDGYIGRCANLSSEVEACGVNADFGSHGSPLMTSNGQSYSIQMKENSIGSHSEVDRGSSATTFEGCMSGVDCELHKQVNEGSINHLHGIPSLSNASSSTEFVVEKHVMKNPTEDNDAAGIHDESALPPVLAGIQLPVKKSSSNKVDIVYFDQDISVREIQDLRYVDSESVGLHNDFKELSSTSMVDEVEEKVEVAHGLESGSHSMIKSASNSGNVTNLASHGMPDSNPSLLVCGATADEVPEQKSPLDIMSIDVDRKEEMEVEVVSESNSPDFKDLSRVEGEKSTLSEVSHSMIKSVSNTDSVTIWALPETSNSNPSLLASGGTAGEVTDWKELQKSPSDMVSIDIHRKKEMEVEVVSEANRHDFKDLSGVVGQQGPASEAEKIVHSGVSTGVVIQTNKSVSAVETSDRANPNKRVIVVLETSKECSEDIQVDPAPCGSKLGKAEDAEAVAVKKHQEAKLESNNGSECPEVSGEDCLAETDKPRHDSTCAVSCSELSETKKTEQEGPMEAGNEEVAHGSSDERNLEAVSAVANAEDSGASKEEKSFTFDVSPLAGLSEGETSLGWQSFPNLKACKMSMAKKGSASTTSISQKDHQSVQEISHTTSKAPEGGDPSGGPVTSERKTRRGSGKSGKENAKRGNNVKKLSPEGSGTKPNTIPAFTSTLPDLNTSVSVSALFHQPFTDLQQIQLRAQIFVYGSLIQGAAPDEACMVSAFGTSDGGRSVWESSWRACVERLHGQKSIVSNYETPAQSRSGFKAQDQSSKQGLLQSKVLPSAASRSSIKDAHSPASNSIMPLSSPLWNIPTPSCDSLQSNNVARGSILEYQALPLHRYQTPPPMRTFGGQTTWLSQAPFPGHWVASPQSCASDFSSRLSSLPITETVKVTPAKDASLVISSGTRYASNPSAQGGPSSAFAGTSIMLDGIKMTGSSVQHSADPKSRKRKKNNSTKGPVQLQLAATLTGPAPSPIISNHLSKKGPTLEDLGPISLLARNQTELVSSPVIGSHFSTSIAVTASPSFVPKNISDKFPVAASLAFSTDPSKKGDPTMEKSVIHAEDFNKVVEAKLQAEEAAADAASAVDHCQSLWTQLDSQRSSGLISEVEAKLSSAAVAIAAAASVAKAAAAAAKIASNAALQAKQMADEALTSNSTDVPSTKVANSASNFINNVGNATPASILKGGDGDRTSYSIIFAAREAARRKIEAASSASRHAENLDAIVKAAELAAEAASQAGIVVAMGEPLPLSVVVESGPESYQKGDMRNIESLKEIPKLSKGPSDQEMSAANRGRPPLSRDRSRNMEDSTRREEGSFSVVGGKKDFGGRKGHQSSDLVKAITSIPESIKQSIHDSQENVAQVLKDNDIKEGCLVEVFKDGGNFKGAWYSANVLSLNGGKAFVCYTELQSNEGPGLLREWVALDGEGNEVPLIRIPHSMSSMLFEGTRKRRRAALRDYNWSVGDRVDAWIEDCWREGVITEKNKNDETTLTVHFPAQGETSVVRAWHLRPTLMWKNGEWTELPASRQPTSSQGDTPQDKRQKLRSPVIVESEKDELSKLLPLSSSEKVFNIGSDRVENKADGPRTIRSGLQKEGSKVIFGVPKPGKKRKFMEVSKHYVSEAKTKNSSNDSEKLSKHVMPQGSGSRRWNNSSRIDTKEKLAAESKLKANKSFKLSGVSGRTLSQKENSSTPSVSTQHETNKRSRIVKNSLSNENESGRANLIESGSATNNEAVEVSITSQAHPLDRAKKGTTNAKSEQLIKGKLVPAGGKSTKFEVKDKPIPGVIEPRRSNRRIQPTSRLLEGLQSSLIVSKVPSASHDKSQRSHNNGTSRGTNNHS